MIISSAQLVRTRRATKSIFLVCGLGMSSWAPMVPFAKERLQLNDAGLGLLLLLLGAGAIVMMPLGGVFSHRYGSRIVMIISSVVLALMLPLLIVLGSVWWMGVALFVFGAGIGSVDVAMNAHAVQVQNLHERPIMSSLHGLFSVGGLFGSLGLGFLIKLGLDPVAGAVTITTLLILIVCLNYKQLLDHQTESSVISGQSDPVADSTNLTINETATAVSPPTAHVPSTAALVPPPTADLSSIATLVPPPTAHVSSTATLVPPPTADLSSTATPVPPPSAPARRATVIATRFPWLHSSVIFFGAMCFAVFLSEGAMLDWSAVFLRENRGVEEAFTGIGYAAFSIAMATMRLMGDGIVSKFSGRTVVIAGGIIGAAGIFLAISTPWLVTVLAGFTLLGIGAANIVPVFFSEGGRIVGIPPTIAIPAITTMGYAGQLAGPALLGFIAFHFSLPVALGFTAVLMALVAIAYSIRKSDVHTKV